MTYFGTAVMTNLKTNFLDSEYKVRQNQTKLESRQKTTYAFCPVLYVYMDSLECLIGRMTFQHSDMCGPTDKFPSLLGLLFNINEQANENQAGTQHWPHPFVFNAVVLHANCNQQRRVPFPPAELLKRYFTCLEQTSLGQTLMYRIDPLYFVKQIQ